MALSYVFLKKMAPRMPAEARLLFATSALLIIDLCYDKQQFIF